jgi:hypothetical protein
MRLKSNPGNVLSDILSQISTHRHGPSAFLPLPTALLTRRVSIHRQFRAATTINVDQLPEPKATKHCRERNANPEN